MLKAAIVGCGKIADNHAEQIRRIPGAQIVAACDREPLMARQICDRFQIPRQFTDLGKLLTECHPQVVHITTPPQSHFAIGKQCLESGANIYVEKPFTVTGRETEQLVALAEEKRLKLTAGHDLQFTPVARRMRQLVASGYLGGAPVHIESYYCYELENATYAKALLANSDHWVRQLPGKLLHNIISHGIARIAEFLETDRPEVFARAYISPLLRSLGECEIYDELRVVITENSRLSAYFTFSSQMRPGLNGLRIFGPRNGLALDQEQETVVKLPGQRLKSYLEKFIPQWRHAGWQVLNSLGNINLFLHRDFQMKSGMKHLIEQFYRSIAADSSVPISYREILRTAFIMDRIFEQAGESLRGHISTGALELPGPPHLYQTRLTTV